MGIGLGKNLKSKKLKVIWSCVQACACVCGGDSMGPQFLPNSETLKLFQRRMIHEMSLHQILQTLGFYIALLNNLFSFSILRKLNFNFIRTQ